MTNIIITGANGFIGTNLALRLLQNKNNKILNIDKYSYCSNSYFVTNQNRNFQSIKINLLKLSEIEKLIFRFKPNFLYHLAAETHVDQSLENPLVHYDNNIKATLHLLIALERARKKKILSKDFRFIHVGTDEIYGDLPFNSKLSFDENKSLSPNNPYSASKAAAVLMVQAWYKNFNFPCIITNSVNNFGIFQYVEKFIPRSILTAKKKKIVEVYGQGQNIRSWISANEHADALVFLAKKGITGEMYNISSLQKFKNIELANKIIKILKDKNISAKIKLVFDRPGHDRQYSINCQKLNKLGWRSKLNFDFELIKTVDWYLNENNLKYFTGINKNLLRKGLI